MKNSYIPKYFVQSENVHTELAKHILADGFKFVPDFEKSQGAYIYDKITGKKYVDFFTCFASMPFGFNHPKLNNPEFKDFIALYALNKPSVSDVYPEMYATFVKTFFTVAVPKHFKYAFFIEGGALAVENALKVAFDWKVRLNFKKGYSEEKGTKIIHFQQAFHGRSGYTISLTNTDPRKIKYFPKFDMPRILNPKLNFPITEENLKFTLEQEELAINQIKQAFIDYKDDVAAIIIEPIQAEGGENHFRKEFFQELRLLANQNEALLIFDEVQTGMGITGSMWYHEQLGVIPDIISFGKKMQVCGILVGNKIDNVKDNVFHESSRINSTWGGNLIDMVRSTRYLEIFEEDNILENVNEAGKYLEEMMILLENKYPHLVSNLRGAGLMRAFDIKSDLRQKFLDKCYENGLLILACGSTSVRFRPNLAITKLQLKEGIDIIDKALQSM
ncbi:MAG: L-lysine 6-transaminase [Candidatus Kapabacteria bacterium]|nr:L-lysine 6-transaminase [Candidatus Kapabacteria bacterium]